MVVHLDSDQKSKCSNYFCIIKISFSLFLVFVSYLFKQNVFFLVSLQQKNNQWGKTVFEVDTRQTMMLPIKDIALQDIGEENQKFGFEIGEVCFS